MFPEFPHQWERKRYIGFLCSAPRLNHRLLPHTWNDCPHLLWDTHTASNSSFHAGEERRPLGTRDVNPLCPSAHCSHLFSSLVPLESIKDTGASFCRCFTSCNLKVSHDFDPIFSKNWFCSKLILPLHFSPFFQISSCSNLKPLFLFLSLLTNENSFFSFGNYQGVYNCIHIFLCIFSNTFRGYHEFWRRKPHFN